ncbi:hypothetical protein PFISCL1PPCAC_8284, partial [Pristionchus fissidentatus]
KKIEVSKKTLEKKRRERINLCIRRLKELICKHTTEKERKRRSTCNNLWAIYPKWEKADIIELGVELLEESLNQISKNTECNDFIDSDLPSPSCTNSVPISQVPLPPNPITKSRNEKSIWRPF